MRKIIATACLLGLTGCASIVTGSDQTVSVKTLPEAGAACEIKNNSGLWYVPSTPGSVVIDRSSSDMTINCKKDLLSGGVIVPAGGKSMTFGNILFGGVIGVGVDMGTGAAYEYPNSFEVSMSTDGMIVNLTPPKPPLNLGNTEGSNGPGK